MRLLLQSFALATSAAALSGCGLFPPSQPKEARVTLHVADAAMDAGAPDMALRVADIVLRRNPQDVAAMVARGKALYAMGSRDQAQAAYRQAVTVDPANVDAQIGLGRTLIRSDPHAAEAAFLAALVRDPANVVALNDLGIARDMLGQHQDAQKAYRQALALSPDSSDVQTNLKLSRALSDDPAGPVQAPIAAATSATPRSDLVAAPAVPNETQLAISPAPIAAVHREALVTIPVVPLIVARPEAHANPGAPTPTPTPRPAPVAAPPRLATVLPVSADIATIKADASPILPPELMSRVVEQPVAVPMVAKPATAAPDPVATQPAATPIDPPHLSASTPAPAAAKWPSGYLVQIAALDSAQGALASWGRLRARWPDLLAGREPKVQQAEVNQRSFWRLRTGEFADAGSANDFCSKLRAAGSPCWAVPSPRE